MQKLLNVSGDSETLTNTDTWWKPIDEIRMKIYKFNHSKGLKTIMGGAWTYDKLVQNARKKGYKNAECMNIEELIAIID